MSSLTASTFLSGQVSHFTCQRGPSRKSKNVINNMEITYDETSNNNIYTYGDAEHGSNDDRYDCYDIIISMTTYWFSHQ